MEAEEEEDKTAEEEKKVENPEPSNAAADTGRLSPTDVRIFDKVQATEIRNVQASSEF